MPKGIPLTDEELHRRRHEIFASSVHLFIEKGFSETSMREIAEAAGMGKSSLYNYFKSKDEILLWEIEDALLELTAAVQEIARQPLPVSERLRQVMQMHLDLTLHELPGNWIYSCKLAASLMAPWLRCNMSACTHPEAQASLIITPMSKILCRLWRFMACNYPSAVIIMTVGNRCAPIIPLLCIYRHYVNIRFDTLLSN